VIKLLVARPKHSKELLMNSTIQKSWRIKVLRSVEVNMRNSIRLTFLLVMLVTLRTSAAWGQVEYTVTDLGTLGGTGSLGTAVNNRGQVSGKSFLPDDTEIHAFVWENGVMVDLGTLGGSPSEASFLNQRGQLAGGSYLAGNTVTHAVLWNKGLIADLGTLGGSNSFGSGINSRGHVAGFSDLAGQVASHAFLWIDGVITDLGTLGGANSWSWNLDDRDRAAGASEITTIPDPDLGFPPFHATLWVNRVPQDLGTLGGKLSEGLFENSDSGCALAV
jgi:probable HAF family extracellular repeat protein